MGEEDTAQLQESSAAGSAEESSDQPQVSASLYFYGAGVLIAILWGWYLLEQFTSLRLTGSSGVAHQEPVPILVALIGTPLALIVATVLWRRALGIARNGVELTASVVSVGGKLSGMRDVKFTYSFEGTDYTQSQSVSAIQSDELEPGSELPITVDKRHPKRVILR